MANCFTWKHLCDLRFKEGTQVTTSSIKELNTITKKAKTQNTLYELGEPDPQFIEYIKSCDHILDDYIYIDINDIKIEEKTYFEMNYSDFEKIVKKVYGCDDYEYVDDAGCGNYCNQLYDHIEFEDKFSKYDEEELKKFIETGKGSGMSRILLMDMCRKKIIKPGNYIIDVCW